MALAALALHAMLCAGGRTPEEYMAEVTKHADIVEPPPHVIRLHRNDHSGLPAMVEAEARWRTQHGPGAASRLPLASSALQVGSAVRRVKMSSKQIHGLRDHQRQSSTVTVGVSSGSEATLQGAHHHRSRSTVHAAQSLRLGGDSMPVTGLSSLQSQFVGPLGVGTMAVPTGCADRSNASLVYIPPSEAQGDSLIDLTEAQQECHATSESQIWVIFDTGSTNLWIASDRCKSKACFMEGRSMYNHSRSLSWSGSGWPKVHIQFGTGSLSGPMAVEDFHLGPFTLYNQTFGMIEVETGSVFEAIPFSGILGLAFPGMAAQGTVPFFDSIIGQTMLPANEFTFYFSMDNPAANAIMWGAADKKFYEGEIEYFNVTQQWYWSLDLKAFYVGDKQLIVSPSVPSWGTQPKAIVDSGTTFFTAESSVFQRLQQELPETLCDKITDESHPDIIFTLIKADGQERNFTFHNQEYLAAFDDAEGLKCITMFSKMDLPSDHGPGMILGEVFIRHYLTKFDRGTGSGPARVGFARAVHGDDVESHLHTLTKGQPVFPGLKQPL